MVWKIHKGHCGELPPEEDVGSKQSDKDAFPDGVHKRTLVNDKVQSCQALVANVQKTNYSYQFPTLFAQNHETLRFDENTIFPPV